MRVRLTARAGITPEVASVGDPPDDVVWGTATLSQHEDAVGGMVGWELVWPVQVFRVGPYDLPPIEIGVGTDVLLTEPFPVDTVSVREGADAEILRVARPPVPVYRTSWVPAIIGAVAAVALAGFAIYRRRPHLGTTCILYTYPSPLARTRWRMPTSE